MPLGAGAGIEGGRPCLWLFGLLFGLYEDGEEAHTRKNGVLLFVICL